MVVSFTDFLNNLISIPSFLFTVILVTSAMLLNGAVDVPSTIATCISTRCMSPKKAMILVLIFNSLGILIMTSINAKVAETIFSIVNFGENVSASRIALCSALISIAIWSIITWFFEIPSSQSHAIVAGLSGAAISLQNSFSGINLQEWKKVIIGLIVMNLLVFIIGFVTTKIIELICKDMDRRKTNKFFGVSQIFSSAIMSFMNGAQDGQKFIGIFFLGVALSTGTSKVSNFQIPLWLILYCVIFTSIGAIFGGIKSVKSIATKVSKLEKYQGAATDFSTAICLFISSIFGIPVRSF